MLCPGMEPETLKHKPLLISKSATYPTELTGIYADKGLTYDPNQNNHVIKTMTDTDVLWWGGGVWGKNPPIMLNNILLTPKGHFFAPVRMI